jgi:cobalt-zinc-cadmium efflux system membrane fusion protein
MDVKNFTAVLAAACLLTATACSGDKSKDSDTTTSTTTATTTAAGGAPSELVLPDSQRARVRSVVVSSVEYAASIQTTGTVAFDGDQSTQVMSAISGPVTRVMVQPGATVSRGQPLAYVSSPDFATAIADYRKAAAAQRNAKRIADQNAALFRNDAIARTEVEQAQTDLTAADADLEAAMQSLRALGVDPQAALNASADGKPIEGVIRAPISGTVVERLITPGQLLQAGSTACFTIADLSQVWVMANIFTSDLSRVAVGDHAVITTSASPTKFGGRVDYIAALVDPSTKATAVRIVAPNTGRVLRRDMYVDVTIESQRKQKGLLIPAGAVLRDDDNQPFVFLDMGNGKYVRHDVTLGSRIGDSYPIATGLNEGDKVVSEGALFLQFAQSQ